MALMKGSVHMGNVQRKLDKKLMEKCTYSMPCYCTRSSDGPAIESSQSISLE